MQTPSPSASATVTPIRRPPAPKELRDSLDGFARLARIDQILQWLLIGYMPEYQPPDGSPSHPYLTGHHHNPYQWRLMEPPDAKRLKTILDTELRLLAKVLPDLKAVEFTDLTPNKQPMTDLELAAKVSALVGPVRPLMDPRRREALAHAAPTAKPAIDHQP